MNANNKRTKAVSTLVLFFPSDFHLHSETAFEKQVFIRCTFGGPGGI